MKIADAELGERGLNNPSSLAFVRDVFDKLRLGGHSVWATAAYGAIVLVVVGVSWRAIAARRDCELAERRRLAAFLFCLVYALVAPRFKNYSYIVLIPVSYWIISRPAFARYFAVWFLAIVVPVEAVMQKAGLPQIIYGYWPLLMAVVIWAVLVLLVSAGRTNDAEDGPSNAPASVGLETVSRPGSP